MNSIINPEILIRFSLDEKGNPISISEKEINHYKVEVSIENIPEDVYAANYQLDSSYISPFREELNKQNSFKFVTTVYGDFSIAANLLGKQKNYLTSSLVSKALNESHKNELSNPKIKEALSNIRSN